MAVHVQSKWRRILVYTERTDRHMQFNHRAQIIKLEDGKETVINISFGTIKIALPDKPDIWYNALVIKGFVSCQ